MKSIIQFTISREDGVYTADAVNAPIITEGSTFEELQENIRDAVALFFEGVNWTPFVGSRVVGFKV